MYDHKRWRQSLGILFILMCVASLPATGFAEPYASEDAPPSNPTMGKPETSSSDNPPVDCAGNDPRPACQIQTRDMGFQIRTAEGKCMIPMLAGLKGAEYEEVVVRGSCGNSSNALKWVFDLITPPGAPLPRFAIRNFGSGRCLYVAEDQLRLRPCSRQPHLFWDSHPPTDNPETYKGKVYLHSSTKLGPIPYTYCLKYSDTPAANSPSSPGIPFYNVSVVVNCPKTNDDKHGFLWSYLIF